VCGSRTTRATDLPLARIERSLRLSAVQTAALAELKDASAKAADTLAQSCSADQPLTPTGRLSAMEQRLDRLLQALDAMQPALTKFYDSLSDEQKARFNRLSPA
jgi:ABC-type transporter MlaC component